MNKTVKVIGGGLAGCEACYQLAKRGIDVILYEMRPNKKTPAHQTGGFAELVCSNSLKSIDENTSQGLLKYELRKADSLILKVAKDCAVPAGGALAVDREAFSHGIENELKRIPNITVIREECLIIDDYTIVATGPLTSEGLSNKISELLGEERLSFYDAVAPIIEAESVDMENAFFAGRYNKGGDDYINCPLNEEEYSYFVDNLISADKILLREFETGDTFNACMPIEIMAQRGKDSLRFGPLRPVGLYDPKTNKRPYAVVQLRKEDNFDKCYNLVGFQTNLKFGEQKRVFGIIPALKNAEFVRYGVMHRNTFINSPKVLKEDFSLKNNDKIFFAGQICGVEGYLESAMSGLFSGISMAYKILGKEFVIPPETTVSGSLMRYVAAENKNYQPTHVSFALLPPMEERIRDKQKRKEAYSKRAKRDMDEYINNI